MSVSLRAHYQDLNCCSAGALFAWYLCLPATWSAQWRWLCCPPSCNSMAARYGLAVTALLWRCWPHPTLLCTTNVPLRKLLASQGNLAWGRGSRAAPLGAGAGQDNLFAGTGCATVSRVECSTAFTAILQRRRTPGADCSIRNCMSKTSWHAHGGARSLSLGLRKRSAAPRSSSNMIGLLSLRH